MEGIEELRARVGRIERELARQSELRAAQDRDLSPVELKVDSATKLLQALGLVQSSHSRMLRDHGTRLDRIDGRLDAIDARLDAQGEQLNDHGRQLAEHGFQLTQLTADMAGTKNGVTQILQLLQAS